MTRLFISLFMMCEVSVFGHTTLPETTLTNPIFISPEECGTFRSSSFEETMALVPTASMDDANMEWILFVQYDNDIWFYDIPPTPHTTIKQLKSHKQTHSEYFSTLSFQIDVDIPSFVYLTIRLIHKDNKFHNTTFGTASVLFRLTDQKHRKETQNLYNLYQNAQIHFNKLRHERVALETQRNALAKQYLSLSTAVTSSLPKTWSDTYLTESFKSAVNGNKFQSLLNPTGSDTLYKMSNIFTNEFVIGMINEINRAQTLVQDGEIELTRPNSMNNDGFVLAELGYDPLFEEFRRKWMSKITSSVYPFYLWCGESLDSIHAFTIRYADELDRNLSRHMDESQITFNLCLQNDDLVGSKIWFNGVRDNRDPIQENISVSLVSNDALMHVGQHWHRTENIQKGQRMNMVLWFRGSQCKKSISEFAFEVCPQFRQTARTEL
eukprot:200482_1